MAQIRCNGIRQFLNHGFTPSGAFCPFADFFPYLQIQVYSFGIYRPDYPIFGGFD
jgi:hypothetical protein